MVFQKHIVYGECYVRKRVLRYLDDPDQLLRYIMVRANSAGFSIAPARVQEILSALKALSSQDLSRVSEEVKFRLLEDVFAAYMAQDEEKREDFRKFWRDLWYVCVSEGESKESESGLVSDRIVDELVDRISKRIISGIYVVPPEVIQE